MKVVLFCGGQGLRLRESSDVLPKPMTRIGYRPILWHVMRYYAHYGHSDFVLCLGYRADVIKDYFLHYDEAVSNDFVLSPGRQVEHLRTDIADWRITFADTGARTLIGQRLLRVRNHLAGEDMFLATYGDCLTDVPLDQVIEQFKASGRVGAFISVPAKGYPFHLVEFGAGRPGDRRARPGRCGPADQRRLLRLPPRDLRLHQARRGAGRGAVPAADLRGPAAGRAA